MVQQRKASYYSRVKVPVELQPVVGKQELVHSLHTKRLDVAKARAAALEGRWRAGLMEAERNKHMDEAELKKRIRHYFDESERIGAADWLQVDLDEAYLRGRRAELDFMLAENAKQLAGNDFTSSSVALAIGALQLPSVPPVDSLEYRKLAREVLQAHAELLRRARARLDGVPDTAAWWQPEPAASASAPAEPESIALSLAIRQFTQKKIAEGAWRPKTQSAAAVAFADLLGALGDPPVASVTKADMSAYWVGLLKRRSAPATANKDASFVKQLFAWLLLQDAIKVNPCVALGKAKVAEASQQRQAFTDDDLQRIFADWSAVTKGKPERYWVPLLLAYTGARLDEVASLHKADVQQVDGIWCLSINTKDQGKRVKTAASRRMVPLHSALLARGFLAVVERAPKGHLWPALPLGPNGYGGKLSKWFNRRLKQMGFESGKVLHSFRHTVATRLKSADVQEFTIAEIVGHKVEGMTVGRYGKRLDVGRLREAIEKLKLPI